MMMKMIQSYDVKKGMAVAGVLLALGCFGHGAFCPCFNCQEARDAGRAEGRRQSEVTWPALPPPPPVTIQPRPRPRYDSMTGIDIAIRNVRAKGRGVTVATVWDELKQMDAANDIWLPGEYKSSEYGYLANFAGTARAKARWKREAEDPKAKREFRLAVAQKVARVSGGNVQAAMEEMVGPDPRNYHSKERFVSAYVSYKLRNVDDETRQQYAKKIGGMGDYRRDMAREAAVLWKNR